MFDRVDWHVNHKAWMHDLHVQMVMDRNGRLSAIIYSLSPRPEIMSTPRLVHRHTIDGFRCMVEHIGQYYAKISLPVLPLPDGRIVSSHPVIIQQLAC